ncbi:hypothetical protein N8580_04075, partial [Akkermansiaceae bacterium]|nr:hypothetical protein [Akkermansiaceae bacterium]
MTDHQIIRLDAPFPDSLAEHPAIIFHGTSAINAERIESNGFGFSEDVSFLAEAVKKLVGLYEMISWTGIDPGGYAVLKGFSYDFDLQRGTQPTPNYFTQDL